MIRLANAEDAIRIAEIYNYYVLQTAITFEEEVVADEEMRQRICETPRWALACHVAFQSATVVQKHVRKA